jgi:hypothetical protein
MFSQHIGGREASRDPEQAVYESWGDATETSAWDQYISEMRKHFDYLANWTPGYPLALGDVGVINHGIFRRITSLEKLGISYDVRSDDTPETQKYASARGVSVSFKAAGRTPAVGSVLTQAEAGFTVEFSSKHSTLYEAIGCTTPSIVDLLTLGEQVLRLYQTAQWNRAWVVVVELVHCESTTILISSSSNSKLELSAKGNISSTISIADANIELGVAMSRDMQTAIIADKGLRPLYRVVSVDDYINNRVSPRPFLENKDINVQADLLAPASVNHLIHGRTHSEGL